MRRNGKCQEWFYSQLSFAGKFRLLFCCGIIVPMFIMNMVNYWQTEKNVQEEIVESIEQSLDNKIEKINGVLENILTYTKGYYDNEILYQYLDREYVSDLEYLILYQERLSPMFAGVGQYPYHIRSVHVYTDNPTLLNGSHISKVAEVEPGILEKELTYLNLQPIAGEKGIYFRTANKNIQYEKGSDSRSLSILCELNHYKLYGQYRKVIRVELDISYVEEVLKEAGLFDNVILTDSKGSVVAAAKGYSNTGEMALFQPEEAKKDGLVTLSGTIGKFPLVLYGTYDSEVIAREFSQSRLLSFGISLLCIMLAFICIYLVVGNMNHRLARLVEQSVEISRGNFVQIHPIGAGRDEFGVLENSLNQMSAQLEELIDREYKARLAGVELEKESNQAKLLALQSQVNPHFMFNALESVRLKALVKGEKETAGVIRYMARMFRNLLEWEDNIITVKEETGFLDEFLHIQSYRFEDEFSYEMVVAEEAWDCLLPKMILQPLVENACIHGVEAIAENRWVRVEVSVRDGMLEVTVEDNGGGMPADKLQELRAMLSGETKAGKSVGLWNVNRRLVLYYGDDSRLTMESIPGSGTRCGFRIPLRRV